MSRSVLPVQISPHLVPFFFQEFEGIEAMYLGKKVKAASISTSKPLGKIIRMLVEKSPVPEMPQKFALYLSVTDRAYFGQVYRCASGKNSFLRLPAEGSKIINEHLEQIFRTSMIYFVEGHMAENDEGQIRKAIDLFLIKYDLYEYGFEIESLRRYYYRVIGDGFFLKKMQHEGSVKFPKTHIKKFASPVARKLVSAQLSLF